MKSLFKLSQWLMLFFTYFLATFSFATVSGNQTDQLSPVLPNAQLPFRVVITKANFQLPVGIHSGVVGIYKGLWVFIAGRTNGLHGFANNGDFPLNSQNMNIYVVNPVTGAVLSRSLNDPSSGLNQHQIDTLAVTSPQSYQVGHTLYMTGGYGYDTTTGVINTKPVLTAINLPGIIKWVSDPTNPNQSVIKHIRQIVNPIFQVAGGQMFKVGHLTLLVFGQDFTGEYTSNSNGNYIEQVRRFRIFDDGKRLSVDVKFSAPLLPDANFRRRDLNVVPFIRNFNGYNSNGLLAYSGVFTEQTGVWTVPVVIDNQGFTFMSDPNLPSTFKQAMNQYVCATAGLYSRLFNNMYNIFFGGMTYGFFNNGVFQTDSEIPFTNEVTTVKMDKYGNFSQYLMDGQYPLILSQQTNPGNQLLFGAGAYFIPNTGLPHFSNDVIDLDRIKHPTVIGYIAGGIASTLPNTNVITDSTGSPYVFIVTLIPTPFHNL